MSWCTLVPRQVATVRVCTHTCVQCRPACRTYGRQANLEAGNPYLGARIRAADVYSKTLQWNEMYGLYYLLQ